MTRFLHGAKLPTTLIFVVVGIAFAPRVVAQQRHFSFDPNGNLEMETPASLAAPQILAQPQSQVAKPGELASFLVVAGDTRGLTYQWRFNSTNLSGVSDALLLTNVSAANEGLYSVMLSNNSGSVTSAAAMLWVDADGDGLADTWEQTYFGNLNRNATGDFDGDGLSNLNEFNDGTNPTNSASALFHLTVMNDSGFVTVTPTKLSYTNSEIVTVTATGYGSETFNAWTGDIVSRSNQVTLVMTNSKTIFAHFGGASIAWTNSAGGDWHNPLNWSPNLVPTSLDNIGNLPAVSITVNASAQCHDVTFTGGTLTGAGDLTINGTSSWLNGNITGTGRLTIAPGATFSINNNSFNITLGRPLENGGTVTWAGTTLLSLNDVPITNRAGALFHIQNAQTINSGGGSPRFDNAGTFRKSVNAGTTTLNVPFNNYGTVDVQSGTLLHNAGFLNQGTVTLAAGTTHRMVQGGSGSGTFNAPANALVDWTGSTFTLNSGANLIGPGLFRVNGATLTCNANMLLDEFHFLSGNFNGSGDVTITNTMTWTAGNVGGTGRLTIAPGATLLVNNNALNVALIRPLENGGTVTLTGSAQFSLNDVTITNRAGALFNIQTVPSFSTGGGSPRFDNAGTFRKSVNVGTLTCTVPFNNYGTMDIQTGTLLSSSSFLNNGAVRLAAGTTHRMTAGGSSSGTFTNPVTALVEWTGPTFTLNSGAQLNGSGLYKIGGPLICNPDVVVVNLDLNATLDGPGIVTVNNLMNWTGGTMSGSGRTVIAPGATMNMASPFFTMALTGRTLENGGTFLWATAAGLNVNGAVITNRAGALFDAQNAGTLSFAGGSPRFDNVGTFRKSASSGTTTVSMPFNNYGTVDLRIGILSVSGSWISSSNSILNCALGGTGAGSGYGQLQKSGVIALDGALSVDFLPGFTPATNDAFTVVTAGTRSGTFSSFSYPANRVTMLLTNTPTAVVLNTTAVLPIAQPMFLAAQLENPNVRLIWTATSNVTYRLEYNGGVASTNWTTLPGDVTTLSNTATKLDAFSSSNRFYRVRVVP